MAKLSTGKTECILGVMGFLSRGKSPPETVGAEDIFDTLVSVRDCSGERGFEAYAEFLNGVKLVSSGYNR